MEVEGAVILAVAGSQVGVSCTTPPYKQRVIDYIHQSANFWTHIPEKRSWCGDFAYWVLAQAHLSPMPVKAHWSQQHGANTISRFFVRFPKTTDPLPGDIYYRPFIDVNGVRKDVQHVGFVIDPSFSSDRILAINGNATGLTSDWHLGIGGGCVSIGTAPLTGSTRVHTFLAVAARPVTIEGRWEVAIGSWTWHYVFRPHSTSSSVGEVLCTDIRNTRNVRFVGGWKDEGTCLTIGWQKTNSEEIWDLPLVATGQPGRSPNKGYSVIATKIEGKDAIAKEHFTYHLD
jgi:hypothetical protein